MWTMLAQALYRSLLRDDLGVGTRISPPTLTQVRATSTAVTDFYKKQQAGTLTADVKTEASKDLLALSGDKHLSTSELAQVKAIQAKIDTGKPLSAADVKQVGAIVDHLEAQLQAQPGHAEAVKQAEALYNKGDALMSKGRYAEAETEWRKAIATCPADETEHQANLQNSLGLALQSQGKKDEAIAAFQKSIELSPKGKFHETAELNIKDLQSPSVEKARQHYAKGDVLFNNGAYAGAESEWRQAIAACPENEKEHQANLQNSLGEVLQRQGKKDEAIAAYKKSLELSPTGEYHAHAEAAIKDLESPSLEKSRQHYEKGDALMNITRYDLAEMEWRQAIAACPDNEKEHQANLQNDLGLALEKQGKKDEAIAAFQKSLELSPKGEFSETARDHLKKLQ